MTRRIFRNILLTAVLALLLSSALLVGTLYNVYEGRISAELRTEAEYIVRALDMLPETAAPANAEEQNLTLEIMKLPAKYREVALLCWYQGMTREEAAETLQITHQAVSSRLNRARKKLRAALEGCEEE